MAMAGNLRVINACISRGSALPAPSREEFKWKLRLGIATNLLALLKSKSDCGFTRVER